MKRILTAALAAVMLVSMLAACSPPGAAKTTPAPGTQAPAPESGAPAPSAGASAAVLKVGMSTEPISLDPHVGNDSNTSTALMLALEGLLNIVDGKVVPGMAERYEISEDGTVYTFHLRDAKWQDGQPVTAQDFADTYVRMLTRQDAMDLAYLIFPIKNAAPISEGTMDASELGCKVIDDKTLEVTLESAYPFMTSLFASTPMYPIRNDLADALGNAYGSGADKFVGNGPYILKDWIHNDRMVFEKNPDYWNADAVSIQQIDLVLVADQNTMKNMYDTGEIAFMDILEPAMVPSMESYPGFSYYNAGGVQFLVLSHKGTSPEAAAITQDHDFVMALSLAIDRQALVDAMFPTYTPSTGVINPVISDGMGGKWGDTYDVTDVYHKTKADPEAAKALIQGVCERLGYASPADMPTFDFFTQSGELQRTLSEYFQNTWKTVLGIDITVRQLEFAQYWENLYSAPYDICRSGWGPDYDDPFTYLDMWDSRGGWNKTGWVGEDYYNLITQANAQSDPKTRDDMFFEAEKILLTEAPIIPLYMARGAYVINGGMISGVSVSSFGARFDFRYATLA
ncbi:peptide ABC transporter substrate-binding protein [Oscillospiraceae bacterium]|nr:peptide ABC transporter substrate-binding protein [Oscillospiraceae bacterium]BDF76414.1 peptide ABC transporter substrate-binding protein [Oscillospiraceae bacterium]